ncbi:MAG: pyrroline-5-carboxylate reductase [Pseudomonadales bacterium]
MSQDIAFIGAGNMASSLINGLINNGRNPTSIRVSDPVTSQLEKLSELGIVTCSENDDAIRGADMIVLAVKPQVLGAILNDLTALTADQLIVSIAAGVPIEGIQSYTGPGQAIVRCMPNTPALLGAGITALFANDNTSTDQRGFAEAVLTAAGKTLWVDSEVLLDAVTAVSGSGPAYFFHLMEAMVDAGCALGLDAQTAKKLTIETAYGAALMARQEGAEPARLRENVTSPGGTTQRALSVLEAADSRGIINAALAGAAERARELAAEFGTNERDKQGKPKHP